MKLKYLINKHSQIWFLKLISNAKMTKKIITNSATKMLYEIFVCISFANLYFIEFFSSFISLILFLIFPREVCIIASKLNKNPAKIDIAVMRFSTCFWIDILKYTKPNDNKSGKIINREMSLNDVPLELRLERDL